MRFENHDAVGAFRSATLSSLGVGILTLLAMFSAMGLIVLLEHLFGVSDVDDAKSFVLFFILTCMFGLLSGIGIVFFIVDLVFLTKAMREDVAAVEYFFVIATCQAGLYFCSTILLHSIGRTWPVSVLSFVVLGSLWWGSWLLRRRADAAGLVRMEQEGEEFRQELRERNRKRNLQYGRRRR